MKHKYIFVALLIFSTSAVMAQGPDTLWTRTYGGASDDWGYDAIVTSDGNYVIAGATKTYGTNPTTGNAYILKVDGNGDTLWTRVYGGTGGEDVDAVRQTADGGYILAGYTSTSGAGAADCYLIRLDSSGNLVWTHTYGGVNFEEARAVQPTSDGGYVFTGYTTSFGAGTPAQENIYVVKTNSIGDTIWTRAYGGVNDEIGYSIEQTPDGGYLVAGYTSSYGVGSSDAWLLRLNASGDTLWTRTYGGPGGEGAYWLIPTNDSGYAFAGYTATFTPGINQQYLVKIDSAGNPAWSRHYGGADHDQAYCVQQTTDGGYIISGITKSYGPGVPAENNCYVVKTDAIGDTLWTRVLGGTEIDVANAVRQVPDGGYIVTGYTRSFGTGAPEANVYLARYGWTVVPQQVVIAYQGGNLTLWWNSDINPFYRIYSDTDVEGSFATLEGSTSDTTFTISDVSAVQKFYQVVGRTAP